MHLYTYHGSVLNLWNKTKCITSLLNPYIQKVWWSTEKNDLVWMFSTLLHDFSLLVLTWASYNLLISKEHPTTSICTLPLANGTATDFFNLYTAVKIVQSISVVQAPGRKTIVSLDHQLYAKCIHLQPKQDIGVHYAFRPGKLHLVFAMLKAAEKSIDSSGLDSAFVEGDILGPATVEQVKAGKHVKRSIEAHLTLSLALFSRYIEKFLQCNPAIEKLTQNGIADGVSNLEHHRNLENSLRMSRVTTSLIGFNRLHRFSG